MLIQFDLDDIYTEALDHVARANSMSRRAYMTNYIEQCLDKIPGLMKMVRDRKSSGWRAEPSMSIPEYKNALIKELPEQLIRYRFRPLDGSPAIEGIGIAAGPALTQATGRKWTQPEYELVYMTPEYLGPVD